MLMKADMANYAAKLNGRHCFEIWESEPQTGE